MTVSSLEDRFYRSRPKWNDGTTEFHELVTGLLETRGTHVLEIGPGPANRTTRKLATISKQVDGLDIDPRARDNDSLREVFLYSGAEFPLASQSYDVVVADYVMEHVEHPQMMMMEIARVLRPGGAFAFRTPNVFHYVTLASRLTPHSTHLRTANAARRLNEDAVEPYPTFYRFNSANAIRRLVEPAGLSLCEIRLVEKQPSYLRFSSVAFLAGVFYERTVNATELLSGLRANIFGVVEKPT